MIKALVIFLPLVFFIPLYEQFETTKILLLTTINIGGVIYLLFKRERLPIDLIGMILMLFLISATASTILSISPRMSFYGYDMSPNGLIETLNYVVLYFVTRETVRSPYQVRSILRCAIIPTVIASLYAIVQYFGHDPIVWYGALVEGKHLRPGSTMGHPNFLSAYLVMTFPVLLMEINKQCKEKKYLKVFVDAVVALQSFIVILLCQSRGSWLAFLCVVLLWLALSFTIKRNYLIMSAMALGLSVLYAIRVCGGRFGALLSPGTARIEYWTTALRIFKRYPWFGSGTDTFYLAFQQARSAHYWIVEWAGSPHRAHNELLNVAATQGLFGVFTVTLLTLAIGMLSYKLIRISKSKRDLSITLITTVVGFYTTSMFSFIVTSTGTLFIISIALLSNLNDHISNDKKAICS